MIDGIGDLQRAAGNHQRVREFMHSILQRTRRQRVSVLLSYETQELFGTPNLPSESFADMCDNVTVLHYVHDTEDLRRANTVLKSRATGSDTKIRHYRITSSGLAIGEAVVPFHHGSIST
jgi:circadian clock protein KaiC